MKKDIFIIRLNPVDVLTLFGLVLALVAAAMVLAGKFAFALSLLFLAMLADAFDGIMARKFGTERDFGRYLDGFVDVFDYLVVPSMFLFVWGFNTWYYSLALVVFMLCGIIRLSVFNDIGNIKDEDDGLSYLGMPVFWSLFVLGATYITGWFLDKMYIFPVLAVILVIYAFLMINNRRFLKVKNWKLMLIVILSGSIIFALDGWGIINSTSISKSSVSGDINNILHSTHTLTALLIIFPGLVGGILHMVAVSLDWLSSLKKPVSKRLFGENKTLRGFILMPLFAIPGALLGYHVFRDAALTIDIQSIHFIVFGLVIGLAYVVFELPNSFIKRRMGIAPGEESNKFRWFFSLLDQVDSSFGAALVSVLLFDAPLLTGAAVIVAGPVIAISMKKVLFALKLKKTSS